MADSTGIIFALIAQYKALCWDYTANWGRGNPSSYIDNITFKKVITTKNFKYRVVSAGNDLGVRDAYSVQSDGSQKVNFLDYNAGRGIEDTKRIQVYVVDPDNGNQYLVAQWK
ncbi:immunomodulatory protein FIP-Fve [Lentinus tigrinus ALCF2SS1-7]|uniref:Immunomodulatory protein FIP-Fve n=1 Tax=Lentinus tigrinus ALCF2SS1-6 TaxID=1328759 RepID=A0A5C2SS06_9APHY|nr:immunomodulatory protein FIP-Fve [Lentinus tigrinus ALCF2SS1-6]RPD76357.1 immunomodulatory protein FIP-Fve [Lentinus tigrinus ALCF2SS1-7]